MSMTSIASAAAASDKATGYLSLLLLAGLVLLLAALSRSRARGLERFAGRRRRHAHLYPSRAVRSQIRRLRAPRPRRHLGMGDHTEARTSAARRGGVPDPPRQGMERTQQP